MADDSKIIIDLELRKEQAESRLRQFEKRAVAQLEKLQKVQAKYDANPTAFVKNQLNASQAAYGRRLKDVAGTRADINKMQMKIDEESARKGGRLFGLQVNKQTEKFVKQFVGAYVAREAMNLGFAAMYTPGGNNAGLRKAQGTAEGATTGAQVGAAFGPLGAAIGTAVGALAGFTSALIKESKEIQAARADIKNTQTVSNVQTGRQIQNNAFQESLTYQARPAQIAKLQQRIKEIESGSGSASIKSLKERLEEFHKEGDHESNQYQFTRQMYDRAVQERSQLLQQLMQTAVQPYYKFNDPNRYADSRAKQGLYSGVAGQQRMIDSPLVKVQNAIERAGVDPNMLKGNQLQKWVDYTGKMQSRGKGEQGRERFEAYLEKATGKKVDLKGIDFTATRKIPMAGIDFKALNNPVVRELSKIGRTLERIAGRGDRNGSDTNAYIPLGGKKTSFVM